MTGRFKKYNFGGYDFMCRTYSTSRSWGHEVYMMDGAIEVAKSKIRYFNRTWEAYQFQTAICEALENYKKDMLKRYINAYKISNGYIGYDRETFEEIEKPLPRGMKKKLEEEFEQSKDGLKIEQAKHAIMQG